MSMVPYSTNLRQIILAAGISVILGAGAYCGKNRDRSFRGEGFRENIFRVMAVVQSREDDRKRRPDLEKKILDTGRARARVIIHNHVLINCREKTEGKEILGALPSIVESARLEDYDCDDHFCYGFVDFDISSIRKLLKEPVPAP